MVLVVEHGKVRRGSKNNVCDAPHWLCFEEIHGDINRGFRCRNKIRSEMITFIREDVEVGVTFGNVAQTISAARSVNLQYPSEMSDSLSMEILSKVATTLKWTLRAKSKDWGNIWGVIRESFLIFGVGSNMTTNGLIQLMNVRAVW